MSSTSLCHTHTHTRGRGRDRMRWRYCTIVSWVWRVRSTPSVPTSAPVGPRSRQGRVPPGKRRTSKLIIDRLTQAFWVQFKRPGLANSNTLIHTVINFEQHQSQQLRQKGFCLDRCQHANNKLWNVSRLPYSIRSNSLPHFSSKFDLRSAVLLFSDLNCVSGL